jgi:methylthioribulose-1-phosphate dehydratase
MATSTSPSDPREVLIAASRLLYGRGWMAGTAGNLSMREGEGPFWITASGRAKGTLGREDFVRVSLDGEMVERGGPDSRPSAETSIHGAVYRLFPEARACYHVHTIPTNLVTRFTDGDELPLPPIEMIKGLGVWEQEPRVSVAVLPNHLDVPRIAAEMEARFQAAPPRLPGFLIRDHGLTVWAATPEGALNYLELFDYIFGCMVAARSSGIRW